MVRIVHSEAKHGLYIWQHGSTETSLLEDTIIKHTIAMDYDLPIVDSMTNLQLAGENTG